ncbi:MAG: hypothetical protein ACD_80C00168G0009 [uncultured bacterium (gcode 4)]|uniref:Uncharacterized protein n=1 Tax=uncultured bacterium (gcode 4) TaxID=1234023 RepID=K1XWC5_9BACT|nr:MAG: hypothetical protein ACD_80C00168G0009 [uncultured bacterium (gcode 4)]
MAKQIIIGLLVAWMGWAIIYFSVSIADIFGNIAWFDKNLWGTRNGFVISGFAIMVIWFLILFGLIPTSSPTEALPTLTNAPAVQ